MVRRYSAVSNWRIKSITYGHRDTRHILQKRLLGFLWWYNPDNIVGYTTGVYYTYQDALDAYDRKRFFVTAKITEMYE